MTTIKSAIEFMQENISTIFDVQHLDTMAKESGFIQRKSNTISAIDFIQLMTVEMLQNPLISLVIDTQENVWIGTHDNGLAKFDGKNWAVYDIGNSGLTSNRAWALNIDAQENVWVGDIDLAKFDGENWTVYTRDNSGLPSSNVFYLTTDARGNKWIGTSGGGVAVYREGGVILPGTPTSVKTSLNYVTTWGEIKYAKLFQNYPNPFNPETWIPYQTKETTNVVIRIYNSKGQLVRTLNFGQRAAGFYLSRTRAAHWDGLNSAGEKVASGVYFYQLQAGDFSSTRRMLVLK